LLVQSPFYPESQVCHTYILHPPGGVAGGDRLTVDVEAAPDAEALLTTPAAGKFYRCRELASSQRVRLKISDGACLEWLPQENIVFDGARTTLSVDVELSGTARFIGWEILCLGRPAGGEQLIHGSLCAGFEIRRDGSPLFVERLQWVPDEALTDAAWGIKGQPVTANMVATPASDTLYEVALAAHRRSDIELTSVTRLSGLVVCRYLGGSTAEARDYFTTLWQAMRPQLNGRMACLPRIWSS